MHGGKYRAANPQTEGDILIIFFKTKPKMSVVSGLGKGVDREGLRRKTTSYEAAFCRVRVF
jgi:hypothetical protein